MEKLSKYIEKYNNSKPLISSALTRKNWTIDPYEIYGLKNPITIETVEDIPSDWYSEDNTVITFPSELFRYVSNSSIFDKNIKTVKGNLENLYTGDYMFKGCTNLRTFDSSLKNLHSSTHMFDGCNILSTITGNIELSSEITNGSYMFNNCKNLRITINLNLPKLTNGSYMFNYSPITFDTSNINLMNLTSGSYMFAHTTIKSFEGDLPKLTSATDMFAYSTIESFEGDLSNLSSASDMFRGCSKLKSFKSTPLKNLSSATYMMADTAIEEWDVEMPKLKSGIQMFTNCRQLRSFTADISHFTNCSYMFQINYKLSHFTSDLSGITSDATYMFFNCLLDLESVTRIVNTLPDRTGKSRLRIDIGIDATKITEEQQNEFNTILVKDKNWTVLWQRRTPEA